MGVNGGAYAPNGQTKYPDGELEGEAKRLHSKLSNLGWNVETCRLYAPLTLEIN